MGDDEARFERRAAELGLARTLGLPIDATITARTLAAEPAAPSQVTDLPRISVDGRGAPLTPSSSERRDYTITATLGEGGMGRVQLARQRSLDREVALKTLKPDSDPSLAGALVREARITGALEHPGVIPVHALGVDEKGRPMLVMKRIDGVDFGQLLRDPAQPAWHGRPVNRLVASLEILMQVCLTVEFAHSRGVIHRDIKPENIMVGGFGEVYLLDWGIATHTSDEPSSMLVGTPAYLAPEMVLGEPVTLQTDVYLLGATLHEILTGRCRHPGGSVIEVLRLAAQSAPVEYDSAVPEELARLSNRATARDPKARPAGAAELREAIADFLRHRSARALADVAVERIDALEKLLGDTGAPADLAQAYRLVTEARFGLVQSLREHPADEAAQRIMQRCLTAAIELELRQDHAESAGALFRELSTPDPALERRIAESRANSDRRARERERLHALEHDLDPTERSAVRSRMLLWGAIALSGVSAAILSRRGKPTPKVALLASLSATIIVAGALLIMRKRMLTNAFNRRLGAVIMLAALTILAHRVINVIWPIPIETVFSFDLLMLAALAASVSATVLPRMWLMSAPLLIGAVLTQMWPDESPLCFGVSTTMGMVAAGWVLARAKTDRPST